MVIRVLRLVFKLIPIFCLIKILPDGASQSSMFVVDALISESKELMSGRVIRIAILHV